MILWEYAWGKSCNCAGRTRGANVATIASERFGGGGWKGDTIGTGIEGVWIGGVEWITIEGEDTKVWCLVIGDVGDIYKGWLKNSNLFF